MFSAIVNMFNTDIFFAYYIYTLIFIIGLVVGSFLNVVALRFLAGESIVFPPSKCPKCQTKLKWYDNIPILAYILLLGKCRYCKKPISIQYPIVEMMTGITFLLIFMHQGFSLATIMLWILFSCGIVMCVTDFKEQIIFDSISIPLIPIGLVYSFFNLGNISTNNISILNFNIPQTFTDGIIGIVIAFLFFEIISLVSKICIKQRAFGEGDTIIAMVFGAWFGWKVMLLTIILSVLVQSLFTLPIMISNLIKSKDKKAITAFYTLLFCAICPVILNQLQFLDNITLNLSLVLLVLIVALISSMIFLRRMKELNIFTFLPFGPALIIAGFISAIYLAQYIPTFLN